VPLKVGEVIELLERMDGGWPEPPGRTGTPCILSSLAGQGLPVPAPSDSVDVTLLDPAAA
jgi:hypothetical protein